MLEAEKLKKAPKMQSKRTALSIGRDPLDQSKSLHDTMLHALLEEQGVPIASESKGEDGEEPDDEEEDDRCSNVDGVQWLYPHHCELAG